MRGFGSGLFGLGIVVVVAACGSSTPDGDGTGGGRAGASAGAGTGAGSGRAGTSSGGTSGVGGLTAQGGSTGGSILEHGGEAGMAPTGAGGASGKAGKGGSGGKGGSPGSGGDVSGAGEAGSGGYGEGTLDAPCDSSGDCAQGLTCVQNGAGSSGPAHGMCTLACATHSACRDEDPSAMCVGFTFGAYCTLGCQLGADHEPKCAGRPDMLCGTVAHVPDGHPCADFSDCSLGQDCQDQQCATAVTGCLPWCRGDFDCDSDEHCDVASGACVDATPGGLPLGSPCTTDAGSEPCGGFCLSNGTGHDGYCSAYCAFSVDSVGCGWDGSGTADTLCMYSTVLSDPNYVGAGDLGMCGKLCDCNSDCTADADYCMGTLSSGFGRHGLCRPLLAGETVSDSWICSTQNPDPICAVPATASSTLSLAGTARGATTTPGGGLSNQLLPGGTVQLYGGNDNLLATTTTNAGGAFLFSGISTSGLPLSFHLTLTKTGYLPTDYYPALPATGDILDIALTAFTPEYVGILPAATGVTFDNTKCMLVVGTFDCAANPLSGATISSDAGGEIAYIVNNIPQTSATATDGSGVGFVFNANPGAATVSVQYAGVSFGANPVACTAGHIVEMQAKGTECVERPCKLTLPQCGCDADEQCSQELHGRACIARGTGEQGDVCTDTCAPGFQCTGLGPDVALCLRFCENHSDCAGPGSRCVVALADGMGGTIADAKLCSESCEPISSSGCPAGTSCRITDLSTNDLVTYCTGAGASEQGEPCPSGDECAPGFLCVNTGESVCAEYCNVDAPSCGTGLTCVPLFDQFFTLNTVWYGVCL